MYQLSPWQLTGKRDASKTWVASLVEQSSGKRKVPASIPGLANSLAFLIYFLLDSYASPKVRSKRSLRVETAWKRSEGPLATRSQQQVAETLINEPSKNRLTDALKPSSVHRSLRRRAFLVSSRLRLYDVEKGRARARARVLHYGKFLALWYTLVSKE